MPVIWKKNIEKKSFIFNNTVTGFKENRCAHPRGKGVGGSGLLNALIYLQGNRKDLDLWCKKGNPGWCYDDVLPHFLKSEDFYKTDPLAPVDMDFYHAKGGLLPVEYSMPRKSQAKIFIKACEESGLGLTDPNGAVQIGVSPIPINTKQGRRYDSGTAFIKPVLKRKNLTFLTNSLVTKVLINATTKEAEGVLFSKNGTLYKAIASKEVILCSGAINSPQLLMLSGIGPKKHLREHSKYKMKNIAYFHYSGLKFVVYTPQKVNLFAV